MKQFARLKFSQNNLKVPDKWQQPQGDAAGQYDKAFKPEEKVTTPAMTVPPLFTPHSLNKYHTDVQKMNTDKIGGFLDDICTAICDAWDKTQKLATMAGVLINGPVAAGGIVTWPPMGPLIIASGPKKTPQLAKYTAAVANTITAAWTPYALSLKVPGLPWYPPFAAVPSPVSPSMPNAVPSPIAALGGSTATLAPATMKNQMISMLGDPQAMYHKEIFDAVADAFDKCFKIWQTSTLVTQVMGFGPVPSFAPPYSPVGPVVGGTGIMAPGGFK